MNECQRFNYCGSPLCPLDKLKEQKLWFIDEEICRSEKFSKLSYMKLQKKIMQRTRNNDKCYLFTMLNRNIIIRRGILGLDPDRDMESQLKRWLKKHPVRKIALRRLHKFHPLC